ncbi:cell division protein FtsB [Legionella sp. CNM-1927-20]|uniref:cell division protein FtsB n=1 Tax=Legionella sp. CNM-1927-20 TaxID=3422221 RepID=UPI00403B26EE
MRPVIIILILAFLSLQYKLWLGDGSILHWRQLERKIAQQTQENENLIARNQAIEADILELKQGDQALEEQARYELGMVKNDEIYYQFIE